MLVLLFLSFYFPGLIHANHGAAVVDYLIKKLEDNVTDHVSLCTGMHMNACASGSQFPQPSKL